MFDGRFLPKLFAALFLGSFLLPAGSAWAGPDFFGVKMKSEDFARDVMIRESYQSPDFTNDRPGTDKRVYAFAYTSTFLGRGRGLSITVHNHSDAPISTERLFRECVILTNDGKRYDRSQPEMEWRRDALDPGEQGTFNVAFPGVDLRAQDIRMIILSFNLGQTKIFLFPMAPPPEAPAKAPVKSEPPAKKIKPQKPPVKATLVKKEVLKKPQPSPKAEKAAEESGPIARCLTPLKAMQSFFRGVGQKFEDATAGRASTRAAAEGSGETETEETAPAGEAVPTEEMPVYGEVTPDFKDENLPVVYPEYLEYERAPQVIEGVTYNFRPNFRKTVTEGEALTVQAVTKDRPWTLSDPDRTMQRDWAYEQPRTTLPREAAEVVVVNPNNIFLVFDAGLEDGVTPNSIVSVLRDGRRVGKAMVSKARDRVSAALILPEWRTKDAIQVGDVVSLTE